MHLIHLPHLTCAMGLVSVTFSEKWNEDHILIVYVLEKYINDKGKVHPRTGHEGPKGEQRYSSTLSLTSALDGVGGQCQAPASLPLEETRYPLYRRLGGPQGWSGQVQKMSPSPGFDPRTVQPVASCYSDYAIPAHFGKRYDSEIPKCPSSCHYMFNFFKL